MIKNIAITILFIPVQTGLAQVEKLIPTAPTRFVLFLKNGFSLKWALAFKQPTLLKMNFNIQHS
jgi:hypothetical protein